MDIFIKIGLALAIGLIGGKLAKLVKLPSVSGYLIAGLFVGPTLFGNYAILSFDELKNLTFISELALAFIAFSIGSEFVVKDLAKYGKKSIYHYNCRSTRSNYFSLLFDVFCSRKAFCI